MFIRWQRHLGVSWAGRPASIRWAATLTECVRVDGKPRQRHVAYLAGIGEHQITEPDGQGQFWEKVSVKLNRLNDRISTADRERIEAALKDKVPCPTGEDTNPP